MEIRILVWRQGYFSVSLALKLMKVIEGRKLLKGRKTQGSGAGSLQLSLRLASYENLGLSLNFLQPQLLFL